MKSRKDMRKRCGYRKRRTTQRGGWELGKLFSDFFGSVGSSEKKEEGMPSSSAPSSVIGRTLPPVPVSASAPQSAPQSMSQPPSFTGGKRKYKKRATKKRQTKRKH